MNEFCRVLEDFYRKEQRILPWRNNPSPYQVWLSEIMLQQTRVEAVVGYYLRFISALPTIEDLARASDETLYKLWEGLGYYSRARNMRKAAQIICSDFHGSLPSEVASLLKLPGIGDYTARAIASIAFKKKEIAVDGNLVRVYSRYSTIPFSLSAPSDRSVVREKLYSLCDIDSAIFNQALMDIGQKFCIPHGAPRCLECPLRHLCKAHISHEEDKYPLPKEKKGKKEEKWTVVLLEKDGRIFLRKRPESGLLASLYEPFTSGGHLRESELIVLLAKLGFEVRRIDGLGYAKHVFTHKIWNMKGYRVQVDGGPSDEFVEYQELEKTYPVPSAFGYFLPR